ncbi:MAG TPA: heme lyase CcmF/NrfE family subunit [Beijerinckiaceae bacterium]|nr:heme lyase CcmF/NrfE family subunit [Beijerinckiaceae bacterium]
MIAELGHFALVLALACSAIGTVLPLWGAVREDRALMATARPAALAQFVLLALAFAALTAVYVQSDFSVLNVYENSHTDQPLIYRFSGVWGNHEGSILLWVLILALFGACVALFGRHMPEALRAATIAVQSSIAFAFLLFIALTSNPFLRVFPAPAEGRSLNPILQDPGLAIHPPLLYLGYVGYSIVFSFAAGALILGRIDAAWARVVRPWNLIAWTTLTAGIAMGSYWAYYELGWGGFWFWDPVENASLMPWLTGTALLHSAIVMERREALKVWTILLAVLTFSLSLLGTFLVRSGVLTSVHAFASDPARGVFILLILCLFIGGAFALFAWRGPALAGGALFSPVSREGSLVLNNLFLSAACVAVLTGTLYPLALEAVTGDKISVGPPFFNATFLPLCAPLVLAMPFGQQLAWKRGDLLPVAQRLFVAILVGAGMFVAVLAITRTSEAVAAFGLGVGMFVTVGALDDLRVRASRGAAGTWMRRFVGLPKSVHATAIAHAGVGLMTIGIAATAFHEEKIATMAPGDKAIIGGYELVFEGLRKQPGPNFASTVGRFVVSKDGVALAVLEPGKRTYVGRTMQTSETGRLTRGLGQIYLAIGDAHGASVDVRAYWKPWVLLIWLGPLAMTIAGLISLMDRRLRVAAPSRRKLPAMPEAAE